MKKVLLTLSVVLASVVAMLAQTTFQVIPPRNVIEGNTFYVTYRLTNGRGSGIQAPPVDGCKLLSPRPGVSTMQSVEIINGHQTSNTTEDYTYTYRAEKEGTYTIPVASIQADGKSYQTQTAQFKVLPPDKNASRHQAQGGYGYQGATIDNPSSQDNASIGKDDIFVRVILNKSHAYEGEAIECTLKLYTKFERINSFMVTSPPTYDGFLIEELNTQASLNEVEHYNGQNYITAVLKKCIIYPQKAGKLTINSGKYDLSVVQLERVSNGFFISARPVEKSVQLQPFTQSVEISPLPQPAPAGFDGAVGQFKFESRMSSTELRTGEAASLEYIITGTGNIKYLKAPRPVIPSEFEQYTPKVEENTRVTGNNMTGTVTAEYTIVPQSVGEFRIPAQKFTYFDISSKQYVTLESHEYTLKVAKGSGTTSSVDQRDIEAKNTDILHIKLGNKNLAADHTPVIRFWWYWAVFGLLLVIMIATVWARNRRERMEADVVGRRTSRANKVAGKRLKAAEGFMRAHDSERFYEEVLKAMWGYLSDKLNMPASQLTRQNIVATLDARGVPAEVSGKVIKVLDDCEMARYTPDSSSETSVDALFRQATETINDMEKSRIAKK
ncbi:MAG: protein BatD [Bacteroidales bacterium]|nr:protein BatD [Bacteroidales bacterium]